jgi:DnaJ-domain-containing protein 1
MLYLVLGALALWLILRASGKPVLKRREWRFLTGALAVAALAGAAFAALREAWVPAAVLLMMGGWLALSTRRPPGASPPPRPGRMGLEEARSILGVEASASPAEIKAAYTRLMRSVHPDKGGTTGLAAQLNAARDRLLRG